MPAIASPPAADVTTFLASTRLLGGLGAPALEQVANCLEWLLVPGGETLCRQGEEGDSLYLVHSGRLAVVRDDDGTHLLLGEVGRGDSVGEVAVLSGRRRAATVRALRDVVVARLSRANADRLLATDPGTLLALIRTIAGWLEPAPRPERRRSGLALAVAPVGELPLADFVARLVRSLAALGETLHITCAGIDERFGAGASACSEGSAEHARVTAWINERETRCRFVVYEANTAGSTWTRYCLRQADRVLVVAGGADEPALGALGPELARLEHDQGRQIEELVLLHAADPGVRPRGTARWLELRPFFRHHHVRPREADFARLARFLDDSAVGLVLGGGGARGLAHLGVIRALEEAGIAIDRIGGTSMGGVIAGLYARGYDWQTMVALSRWGWVELKPHKVYTLPLISLLSTVKADQMLERMYRDDHVEDLWTDYFCVSANLTRAEVVVHRQGSLRRAVSASMTIPGITPPMLGVAGELLVDGGVLNNLPVDVMQRLGEGPVIAVDVSAATDLRADPSYTDPPGPWQILAGMFRRPARRRPFPNIVRLIHRAAVMASDVYAKQARCEVELYLDLPMERFEMFEMEAFDQIVEFGYEFTRQALRETPWNPAGGKRPLAI